MGVARFAEEVAVKCRFFSLNFACILNRITFTVRKKSLKLQHVFHDKTVINL